MVFERGKAAPRILNIRFRIHESKYEDDVMKKEKKPDDFNINITLYKIALLW
ncbi:MAG: hypothetical protein ACTSWN_04770 [Promethearchaeota archaeon]